MNANDAGTLPGGGTPNPTGTLPPLQLKRILVPLDFSPHAQRALRYAAGLARLFQSELVLLHVTEPVVYPSDFGYAPLPTNEFEETFRRDACERLEELARAQAGAGVKAEAVLRLGKPYVEITTAAKELGADLIVITTHGYTGLTHVVLGSTAERVVRHAPCPVLVVRESETAPA